MNVLIAVDGSMLSLLGIQRFIDLAGQLKEAPFAHLLHVHSPVPSALATLQQIDNEALQRYYQTEGEVVINPARGRLIKRGIDSAEHVKVGEPADVICTSATELGCQLIWMGAHGKSGGHGPILGSVAARVVHLAKCSVMIAR